jgi:hypothetical protein
MTMFQLDKGFDQMRASGLTGVVKAVTVQVLKQQQQQEEEH